MKFSAMWSLRNILNLNKQIFIYDLNLIFEFNVVAISYDQFYAQDIPW